MYYLGFLKQNTRDVVIFNALKRPNHRDYSYFTKVMGPYRSEEMARRGLKALKKVYGYQENPIKGLITKDGIRKSIVLSRKVKKLYGQIRKKNPGKSYHDQKFIGYMKELEKYKIGSAPYIATLAKAYEHLESAKDSMREESVR